MGLLHRLDEAFELAVPELGLQAITGLDLVHAGDHPGGCRIGENGVAAGYDIERTYRVQGPRQFTQAVPPRFQTGQREARKRSAGGVKPSFEAVQLAIRSLNFESAGTGLDLGKRGIRSRGLDLFRPRSRRREPGRPSRGRPSLDRIPASA